MNDMENTVYKNFGFIEPITSPDDYVFGAGNVQSEILQENGQWDEYLPKDETQLFKDRTDTYNCTAYGTLNCLEVLFRRLFNTPAEYSERFTGIVAGTKPPGNSPQTVIQSIRKNGLLADSILPFDDSIKNIDEYYSPNPMTGYYLNLAHKFIEDYEIFHEWVGNSNEEIKEALKYSPLGVSVYAWVIDPDGLYMRPKGYLDTHWVCLYGYEDGKYWKVFDSADNTHKKLRWDFGFSYCKRYNISRKGSSGQLSLMKQILDFMYQILSTIQKNIGKIFKKVV